MRTMMKTMLFIIALTFTVQAQALPSITAADYRSGGQLAPEPADLAPAQRGCTTLSEAVEQVRRRTNGRIVGAETRMNGNRETHVIRVLTDDGKVKTHRVPGCTRN